jgi:DNA-binding CsgD family transcriptional regulator
MGIAVMVCDASGRLLLANQIAHDILALGDGLQVDSDNLICGEHVDGRTFVQALQQIDKRRAPRLHGNASAFGVRRPSGNPPFTVLLHSLQAPPIPSRSMTAVFVLDPFRRIFVEHAELYQLFGLTAAETRLANLLMEGKSLSHCCRELGWRRSTGSTHLKLMFRKTRVHTQSQLVLLLLKSIGLLRPRDRALPTADSDQCAPQLTSTQRKGLVSATPYWTGADSPSGTKALG